ncbi:MAG TPA: hypothetical protein VET87_02480, partial [Rubrivivax sp.]|nr:hypothetical protein [Rubrivivax sp.]
MSVPTHQAVVTSRNGPWATLRVRGLLRNAALAARLAQAGADSIEIRLDTGSVRVRLSKQRAETFWIEWLSATVEAHFVAKPPAPPPVANRQRPAVRRLRAPESATAADKAATGGTDTTHSTPIARLLADLGEDRPIDVEQGLTSAQA